MNNKNTKVAAIALGAILILVLGFFALNAYIYNEKQGDGEPTEEMATTTETTDTARPATAPKPAAQDGSGTGTYSGSLFSFTAPTGWSYTSASTGAGMTTICLNPTGTRSGCLGTVTNRTNVTLEDTVEQTRDLFERYDVNESVIQLDGIEATKFTIENYPPREEGVSRVLIFRNGTTVYQISFAHGSEAQFDSVVASFDLK